MVNRPVPGIQIADMPLHDITELLGTEGLIRRFHHEVEHFRPKDRHILEQAFGLASELHAKDRRTREPYINHILRVAIRVVSHYGIKDTDVICAALLHDSIEDHADILSKDGAGSPRQAAFRTVYEQFNARVAKLVIGVTNPQFNSNEDKNLQYLQHISDLVEDEDPWLAVLKLSDFTDNTTGLIYSIGPKVPRSAAKYRPVIPVLRQALERPDLPLTEGVVAHIHSQLDLTEKRLAVLAL